MWKLSSFETIEAVERCTVTRVDGYGRLAIAIIEQWFSDGCPNDFSKELLDTCLGLTGLTYGTLVEWKKKMYG